MYRKIVNKIKYRLRKSQYSSASKNLWYKMLIFLHDCDFSLISFLRKKIYKYKFPKLNKKILPSQIHVEVTNACNAGCIMCPQKKIVRKTQNMQETLYQKIVNEVAKNSVDWFWTFMLGEPLMDNNLAERIKYAKQKGIKNIGFFTNASLFTKDKINKIFDAGIDHITVSLDSSVKQTYNIIRPKLNFDDVINNIYELISIRKKKGSKKPTIVIEFVEMEFNYKETKKFAQKWERIVDAVYVSNCLNWLGDISLSMISSYVFKKRSPCFLLWSDLIIYANGDVPICCYDYDCKVKLGNVYQNTLIEIWHGELIEKIRKLHLEKNFSEISICKNCNAYKSLSAPWWL